MKRLFAAIAVLVAFACGVAVGLWWKSRVDYPDTYSQLVTRYAAEYGLQPAFVHAVMLAESRCDPQAVSPRGAMGLMQLMPDTAKWVAEVLGEEYDPQAVFQPETNVRYGCYYLAYLTQRFSDMRTVAAAYNAGETTVARWIRQQGGTPGLQPVGQIAYDETRTYVQRIEQAYLVYQARYQNAG